MQEYKIAIAGVGVVGKEVLDFINNNPEHLSDNCGGITPKVTDIATRTPRDYENINWHDNALKLLEDDSINLIVELIGGDSGIAYDLVKGALEKGINIVTANKALIAKHGTELFKLAKENNASLFFEAAVGGAIPIIKTLHDNLSANRISEIFGILNGTCNFILTEMANKNSAFDETLKEAQEKGYAEADPTLDVEGIDAAHKIAILASIAFNSEINFDQVHVKGISGIRRSSFKIANELDSSIKLFARAYNNNGKITQYVRPFIVKNTHPLSSVNDALNSVYLQSDLAGITVLTGFGAGGKPTASAVISDICDSARGKQQFFPNKKEAEFDKDITIKQKFLIHFTDRDELRACRKVLDENNIAHEEVSNILDHNILTFESDNFVKTEKLLENIPYKGLFELYE